MSDLVICKFRKVWSYMTLNETVKVVDICILVMGVHSIMIEWATHMHAGVRSSSPTSVDHRKELI